MKLFNTKVSRKWWLTKNISEKWEKNEQYLREKERKKILILKLAQQVTKSIFVQNEVTN